MVFFMVLFVMFSVLGEIVRLIPTENITPATVYRVFSTSSGRDTPRHDEKTTAKAIDTNRYESILFMILAKVQIFGAKMRQ